jgi:hypothetical protein
MGIDTNLISKSLTRYIILSCIKHEEEEEEEEEEDTAEGSVVKTLHLMQVGGDRKFTALNFPRQ